MNKSGIHSSKAWKKEVEIHQGSNFHEKLNILALCCSCRGHVCSVICKSKFLLVGIFFNFLNDYAFRKILYTFVNIYQFIAWKDLMIRILGLFFSSDEKGLGLTHPCRSSRIAQEIQWWQQLYLAIVLVSAAPTVSSWHCNLTVPCIVIMMQ